ncbi:MAG: PIG-L family deacetylase [Candidatus Eisenbacteria bacterium]
MPEVLRLMGVFAHPDDESLGFGGTLARYAAEGVHTSLVVATHGQAGRYRGILPGAEGHPGTDELARIRERELRAAAQVLGVQDLSLLGYRDQQLDRAEPREVIGRIAAHLRRVRPQVVLTFAHDGAYGHPDHVAISQFTAAAIVAAADGGFAAPTRDRSYAPHAVAKLYHLAWPRTAMAAYEEAFRRMVSNVDGVEREAAAWPEWSLSCVIDTHAHWEQVWRAVCCHESQVTAYEKLQHLSPASHEGLWGWQSFYRAMSTVNGGRARETDLFEGLR